MMFYGLLAVLAAGVTGLVTRPLFRYRMPEHGDAEVEAYRLRLAELDRDEERGAVTHDEAGRTRTEVSRRILRISRARQSSVAGEDLSRPHRRWAFSGVAAFLCLSSLALYLHFGQGGLSDQPLDARLALPPEKQSIEIQVANVERRLRENPKDADGWAVIAPVYFRTGQFDKAADAYRRAIALGKAREDTIIGFGEALTFGNNGVIPDPAKEVFALAVQNNPNSLRARFWIALLAEQEGRSAEAMAMYRELLSGNLPDSWKKIAATRLELLIATKEPGSAAESARNSETPQLAASDDQAVMIRSMVERLAAKLVVNPDDLDGWLKLIRSYSVLKDPGKAEAALVSARAQFAAKPQALAKLTEAARNEGLAMSSPPDGRPKT